MKRGGGPRARSEGPSGTHRAAGEPLAGAAAEHGSAPSAEPGAAQPECAAAAAAPSGPVPPPRRPPLSGRPSAALPPLGPAGTAPAAPGCPGPAAIAPLRVHRAGPALPSAGPALPAALGSAALGCCGSAMSSFRSRARLVIKKLNSRRAEVGLSRAEVTCAVQGDFSGPGRQRSSRVPAGRLISSSRRTDLAHKHEQGAGKTLSQEIYLWPEMLDRDTKHLLQPRSSRSSQSYLWASRAVNLGSVGL